MSEQPKPPAPAVTPDALVEFMSTGWAGRPPADLQPLPASMYREQRRRAVAAAVSGRPLLIPTGPALRRSNDTFFRFRPGSDLFWLTGCWEQDAVLLLDGETSRLFVPPPMIRPAREAFTDRDRGELWEGRRPTLDELAQQLAIDTAPLDELDAAIKELEAPPLVRRGIDPRIDAVVPELDDDAVLAEALGRLKLIKDQHEIAQLQAAVDATVLGFGDIARAMSAAIGPRGERWLEGTFERRARRAGNESGYYPIIGAGANACILHWRQNDGDVRPTDMVLIDAGVEGDELYTADVTRTVPVSGTFSPEQRAIYDLVLAAQDAGLAEVRPGAEFLAAERAAFRVMAQGLIDLGVLTVSLDEALDPDHQLHKRFTLHGVSHMLGVDVHDCASVRTSYMESTIAENMVFTVEPGCYFQADDLLVPEAFRGLGVRIEDDILATADGWTNLSAGLPRDADAVEEWVKDGLRS